MNPIIMPPQPPARINVGDGKFSYVEDNYMREMLQNAFAAIRLSEGWEFMLADPGEGGFMFSTDPMVNEIMNNMDKCEPQVGHSGASFGCTMREMQFLARYGCEEHKKRYST